MSAADDVALRQAAERVGRFLAGRAMMRGIDPEDILGVHMGSEHAAVLRESDLRLLLAHAGLSVDEAPQRRRP